MSFLFELWAYMGARKKFWLLPVMLLMVLAASASYIAVPAVIRQAIPEASPSLYFGMSLGVSFPFNILVGIPACIAAARWALG